MKAIGFIDYYLDEWHAKEYPGFIAAQSDEFCVKYAYAKSESPKSGAMTNAEWATKYGVTLVDSIKELVEKSDAIIVLSPDNSELHEELSKEALSSGKPTFVDKTFCNSKDQAMRIFKTAKIGGSACFSSSALRFSPKLNEVDKSDITSVVSAGPGDPEIYIIHQLEPIATLMGTDVEKVMYLGNSDCPQWSLWFKDGRTAFVSLFKTGGYTLKIAHKSKGETVNIDDDFFKCLIKSVLYMFKTNEIPVENEETIKIMAIREVCLKAMKTPCEFVSV